ncbi:MAG: DNA-3-methyladenine glycosylase [Eubacteriales bacterium]
MILPHDFYRRHAPELAPALLGKFLCVRGADGQTRRARITETECYFGEGDTACHARAGKTPRTKPLYESGGIAYVYLCYGIHCLLNVVAGEADFPEAVLLRGVEGARGPGRLTRAMGVDLSDNGASFTEGGRLWVEDDGTRYRYTTAPRVGIDYASAEDRARLWRFIIGPARP